MTVIRKTFLSIAEAIIPEGGSNQDFVKGAKGPAFENREREFFENLPKDGRLFFSMVSLFIWFISFFITGKIFTSCSLEKRIEILEKLSRSRFMTLRILISALKGYVSLIFLSIPENLKSAGLHDNDCRSF